MAYQSLNPFDGALVQSFDTVADTVLETKRAAARACFEIWRHTSYAERARVIAKAGELLAAGTDTLARNATVAMGKRIAEARGAVTFNARIMGYYESHAERFRAPTAPDPADGEAHMERSPIGVIFQHSRLDRRRAAVRRSQGLGLRARAWHDGHPVIRQQEAGPPPRDPRARLTARSAPLSHPHRKVFS